MLELVSLGRHCVGMEGRHSADQPHVEVQPVLQMRRLKLQRQLSRAAQKLGLGSLGHLGYLTGRLGNRGRYWPGGGRGGSPLEGTASPEVGRT